MSYFELVYLSYVNFVKMFSYAYCGFCATFIGIWESSGVANPQSGHERQGKRKIPPQVDDALAEGLGFNKNYFLLVGYCIRV